MESIYFLALFLGTSIGIAVGIGTYLSEMKERKDRPHELARFRERLHHAILQDSVTLGQVKILAGSHEANSIDIRKSLQTLFSQNLDKPSDDYADYLHRIETLLNQIKAEEPFQGLPKEIRPYLEGIHDQLSGNEHLLEPLAENLRRLLEERSDIQRQQRKVSMASLAVGIVGLFAAIFSYWP